MSTLLGGWRRLAGLSVLALSVLAAHATEAVWQWSVPCGEGRAYLWIPQRCARVRGVVLAQNNMIEPGVLESTALRRTLAELDFAAVLVSPPFDRVFDFTRGAGERVEALFGALAVESGYEELAHAPVVPMGHSACASFPWNFAAWNPARTLAVLSLKGDAPQTDLTGSGAPNPEWGARSLAGVPGLFVMSEQEWWEARLAPLLRFRAAHPDVPLAVLADTGHSHFDATPELVEFVGLFLRKAAAARLPLGDGESPLRAVAAHEGWRVARWTEQVKPRPAPVAATDYGGDTAAAFWSFDEEFARATDEYQRRGAGARAQQVNFTRSGASLPIASTHAGVELPFEPAGDGRSFTLQADFIVPVPRRAPVAAKDNHRQPPPVTVHPQLAPPGSHAAGPITIAAITGPVEQVGPGEFRVEFNRFASGEIAREREAWFYASHGGDANYRGMVQQALLRIPRAVGGEEQVIDFPPIASVRVGTAEVALAARASSGLPVRFFVREGPAVVRAGKLVLTPIPPRAKFPVRITVVAWQEGSRTTPLVRTAANVVQSLEVVR